MMKIKIFAVGKSKESWLQEALSEYEKRLAPSVDISWILVKDDAELLIALHNEHSFIALDPKGELLDSPKLSQKVMRLFVEKGSRLSFVLGGPEGIPPSILQKAHCRWSFSPLTFTHQIARLILYEQLYRAFEIAKGSPYHK